MAEKINTEEAAKILNVSRRHVRRLVQDGELTGEKQGKKYVVDAKSVEAKLNESSDGKKNVAPNADEEVVDSTEIEDNTEVVNPAELENAIDVVPTTEIVDSTEVVATSEIVATTETLEDSDAVCVTDIIDSNEVDSSQKTPLAELETPTPQEKVETTNEELEPSVVKTPQTAPEEMPPPEIPQVTSVPDIPQMVDISTLNDTLKTLHTTVDTRSKNEKQYARYFTATLKILEKRLNFEVNRNSDTKVVLSQLLQTLTAEPKQFNWMSILPWGIVGLCLLIMILVVWGDKLWIM